MKGEGGGLLIMSCELVRPPPMFRASSSKIKVKQRRDLGGGPFLLIFWGS